MNTQHVVETDWLQTNLNDPDLRILDCTVFLPNYFEPSAAEEIEVVSGREHWERGHIPGGIYEGQTSSCCRIPALFATVCCLASAQDIAFTPGQFKWTRNPAQMGSEIAPVMGDARQPGTFIVRVRYPAGLKAMPHSHPNDTLVTVISGTLRFAEATSFDETKLKDYPAGSFFVIRANVPHYEMATAPMEFQAYGTGLMAFNFVNPKDDPKSK